MAIASDMESEEAKAARRILAQMPLFSPDAVARARLMRLPGLTNRVYEVEAAGERFCLRIPGAGTAAIIDRPAEEVNARAAAAAGVAPQILYFGADGIMLTRFVEDAVTVSPERFRDEQSTIWRSASALRRLHESAAGFARSFEVFSVIQSYADLLSRRGVELPPAARALFVRADSIHRALEAHPATPRPCHCDPTGGNLLDTGERVWIVDWEYSAMNDPIWDLAYLALEGGFDEGRDGALLVAYFGREAAPPEAGRMAIYKAVADLLSGLWALIQHTDGNSAADFLADARRRFERVGRLVGSPVFARHLETVRQG